MTFWRFLRSSMSMKSTTMMPPRSRRRIWRTISLMASGVDLDRWCPPSPVRLAHEFAVFHVDGHQRLGLVDDDGGRDFSQNLGPQGFLELGRDAGTRTKIGRSRL